MRKTLTAICSTIALGSLLSMHADAASPPMRSYRSVASNGVPFPASDYHCVEYNFGAVVNQYCSALDPQLAWDLPVHVDGFGSDGSSFPGNRWIFNINTSGNGSQGVECFPVALSGDHTTINVGAPKLGSASATTNSIITTLAITLPSTTGSSLYATCHLPGKVTNQAARIRTYQAHNQSF